MDDGVPMSFLTVSLVCSPGDNCVTNSSRGMKPWVVIRGSQAQSMSMWPNSINVRIGAKLFIPRLPLVGHVS